MPPAAKHRNPSDVTRIMVKADQSEAAGRALEWAAGVAERCDAELLLVQVIAPENLVGDGATAAAAAEARLAQQADELASTRVRARVLFESDPAEAILRLADQEQVDLLVVDNAGMSGRGEFLLGNVPNRISHNARCTVAIVNCVANETRTSNRPAEPQEPAEAPEAGQLLTRSFEIGRILLKHGVRGLTRGGSAKEARARARNVREALEELGPTFGKLGQMLSTRPDLIPPELVEELAKLQDAVPPLHEAEVVALMEAEFHLPWEDVFQRLEPEPLAAGTIAQVHRAVLRNGERVVVKVQRPGAEAAITRDLGLLALFSEKAAARPMLNEVVDLPAVIDHLSSSLRRELDFKVEAQNIERMRSVLAPFPRLAVPRVYGELSTSRLLVMEEVQGIPLLDAPAGPARAEAAYQLLESYYQQVLGEGFFHADPHPGNLMWWNDTIYFLDLGMVGELEAELREQLLLALLAFAQEDPEFLAEVLVMLAGGQTMAGFDEQGLRADLAQLVADYRHLTLEELRLGPLIQRMMEISASHQLRLPAGLALAGKAFGQMQLAATSLDPTLDPFAVASRFFRRRILSGVRQLASPRQLAYETQKLKVRLTRLIEGLERVAGARSGPGLRMDIRGTEQLARALQQGTRLVALGLFALTAGLVGLGALNWLHP
ncbi:MAG TPA: AarF/UbiB family protein [Chloroflexota bacterium]|nr:AarF/UbiB family protein [Chloroflexota bacterium]